MKRAVAAPLRSSRALVPRVVARRMAISGRAAASGVPVTSRAASTGASSGERSSKGAPARAPGGSGRAQAQGSCRSDCHPTRSLDLMAEQAEREAAEESGGRSQAVARRTALSPADAAIRPRTALVESTLARWRRPSGSTARQSVKVPPVSIQMRQGRVTKACSPWAAARGRRRALPRAAARARSPCPGPSALRSHFFASPGVAAGQGREAEGGVGLGVLAVQPHAPCGRSGGPRRSGRGPERCRPARGS